MGSLCTGARNSTDGRANVAFEYTYKEVAFQDVSGNIGYEKVDAIVNAANNQLSHRAGLANSLVMKGGDIIQRESDYFLEQSDEGTISAGTVVATSAGSLKAKYIFHVVSPVWTGGDQEEEVKLALGITNTLVKADELELSSIAFPNLSGGMFGFPKDVCAEVMVRAIINYIDEHEGSTTIRLIRFVNVDSAAILKNELNRKLLVKSLSKLDDKSVDTQAGNETALPRN